MSCQRSPSTTYSCCRGSRSPTSPRPSGPVTSVTTAPSGYEGEGFPVRRAFAGVDLPRLDPFIHMDQMGEVDYAPGEPKGTAWHPHRGFETVTYIIDGTFEHQDSHGGGGLITNGDTQWMNEKWSLRRDVRVALLRNEKTPMSRAVEFAHGLPAALLQEILRESKLPVNVKEYLLAEIGTR